MAKQKQDNKTVDIELLILQDKIKYLISAYEDEDHSLYKTIIGDLKELLENQYE